jgi:hypothetical protein
MGPDLLDETLGEPLATVRLQHVDVRKVGKGRLVGDDAREAHLGPVEVDAEAQRIGDRTRDDVLGNPWRPVAAREVIVDRGEVQAAGVGADVVGVHPRYSVSDQGLAGPRRHQYQYGYRFVP